MTGASGHVGAAIAARLVEAGHDVVGLSRRPSRVAGVEHVGADLSDPATLELLLRDAACQAVVHAAAALGRQPHDLSVSLVNCLGTQTMLAAAAAWDAESFVYISSLPVIGLPISVPITEDHPVNPGTAYHASKLYGEHLVQLAARRGLAAASLRLTAPVGPRMPGDRIMSAFVDQALSGVPLAVAGTGTRRQDYVDVRDVADAAWLCLEQRASGVMNVASGVATSNADLARRCVAHLGSSSPVQFGGRPDPEEGVSWEVSIDRAREAISYAPRHSLRDSIDAVARDRSR